MAVKDTLAAMRNAVLEAREGKVVKYGGAEFMILLPSQEQADRWAEGKTLAAEVLRTCVAFPDGELMFAKFTDKQLNKVSVGMVPFVIAKVKAMLEDVAENFGSTATDKPSTD